MTTLFQVSWIVFYPIWHWVLALNNKAELDPHGWAYLGGKVKDQTYVYVGEGKMWSDYNLSSSNPRPTINAKKHD
jgi:hypothetical protein